MIRTYLSKIRHTPHQRRFYLKNIVVLMTLSTYKFHCKFLMCIVYIFCTTNINSLWMPMLQCLWRASTLKKKSRWKSNRFFLLQTYHQTISLLKPTRYGIDCTVELLWYFLLEIDLNFKNFKLWFFDVSMTKYNNLCSVYFYKFTSPVFQKVRIATFSEYWQRYLTIWTLVI